MSKKALYFTLGTLFGTASGILAGMLLAPRSGAESRAMAADAMNDVWDSAVDTYERGAQTAAARERMDQLRDSLSDVVTTTSAQVQVAVNAVVDQVAAAAEAAPAAETPAEAVRVEVVDAEAPETGAEA